jgi:ATP-binding cassette, subfamily B, bacterial
MTSRTAADHAQSALACTAESQALLLEAVTGIESVQAGGGGAHVYSRWSAAYHHAEDAIRHRDRCVALVERVAYVIQYATSGVLLLVALLVLGSGKLSPGDVLALAALGTAAVTPIASVLQAAQQLTIGAAHLDRLRDLFAIEPSRLSSDLPCGRGEVTVANLGYSYDDGAEVLHDVDLCARPGEIVGVVGRSGSGKTTLVRLLAGLLAPTAGAVYLDGVRASEVDPAARPELVAVLPQQPVVLSGSVADNVAFGRPVDRPRVEAALHLAALSDDVRGWRLGIDTPLGEAGIRLSGGQRQRLALARALYTRPRILVLDEPTSSVDALTERAIRDALATLGCTQIVIAHRLATLAEADRIYVLDAGRIVDEGTAAELRHRQGLYRRMAVEQGLVTEPEPTVGERDTVTATPSG